MATVWRETGEETGEEDQGAAVWSLLDLIKAPELWGGGAGRRSAGRPHEETLVSGVLIGPK